MREDIFYHVIELLRTHKDLQDLPHCKNLDPFLSSYFTVPEEGRLGVYGTYRISHKNILVTLWSSKQYRFHWNKITPHLKFNLKRQYLF